MNKSGLAMTTVIRILVLWTKGSSNKVGVDTLSKYSTWKKESRILRRKKKMFGSSEIATMSKSPFCTKIQKTDLKFKFKFKFFNGIKILPNTCSILDR